MKKLLTLLSAALIALSAMAEDQATYLIVGSTICSPITVKCSNGHTYKVYDQVRIEGLTQPREAYDCQGRQIVTPSGDTRTSSGYDGYHYRYYTFKTLYSSDSSYGGYDSSYGGYSNSYNRDREIEESANRAGDVVRSGLSGLAGAASVYASYHDGEAYPGLSLVTGISRGYGEFARLRMCHSGCQLYAGIGKDWLMDGDNKDRLLWHAGIGFYFGLGGDYDDPSMDVALGLTYAENAMYKKSSLTADLSYTYWIGPWKRVGFTGGLSLGCGDFRELFNTDNVEADPCFAWGFEVGIVFRLAKL